MMQYPETVADRLAWVREEIAAAEREAGRPSESVGLIAVSKTHPAEAIREAFDAGQRVFGESRVQEALEKFPLCPGAAQWHFIGHLQSNKARKALPHFDLLHSVDSLDLARDINRIAADLGLFPRVLLEVNIAGEGSKFGFAPDRLAEDMVELLKHDRLQVEGLMGMAPIVAKPEEARPYFCGLRELRDALERKFGVQLPQLSMGMSGDFREAIAEGATLVRVGTAIFGERPKK